MTICFMCQSLSVSRFALQSFVHIQIIMEINIIKRKRGEVLLYNERQYYKHKIYKNLSQIWYCRNRRTKIKCTGSITIQVIEILII